MAGLPRAALRRPGRPRGRGGVLRAGRWAHRTGSRPSSRGWSGAATSGSPRPRPRSATRSAPTCRSAARRPTSAGGFASSLGRVGAVPRGCEETELSIRLVGRSPGGRILLDPQAAVRHYVPAHRTGWDYFWRRCWAEGQSKYDVVRLTRATEALSSERSYVTRTLPNAVARQLVESVRDRRLTPLRRAGVIVVGLLVTTAGFTEAGIRQKSLRMSPARGRRR